MNNHAEDSSPDDGEEKTILWIAFFVGLLPVALAAALGTRWGAVPTIGLIGCVLAALGLAGGMERAATGTPRSSEQ